jgi:hypothetical protein
MKQTTKRWILGTLIAAVCLVPSAVHADEVDQVIDSLKPSPLNYSAWAESLLKAAEGLGSKPEARAKVYGKAYELGMKKSTGYPAAIRAARAMVEVSTDNRAAWQKKLLDVLKRNWQMATRDKKIEAGSIYVDELVAAADDLVGSGQASEAAKQYAIAAFIAKTCAPERQEEIVEAMKFAKEQQRLIQKQAYLKSMLAANPKNTSVRERLIRLHLVEFDDPGEAVKLLTDDVPEALRTYVSLAAKGPENAPKNVCVELGDWYRTLAAKVTTAGKHNALTRTKAWYERFLSLEKDAIKTIAVKIKLAQVSKQLADSGPLAAGLAYYWSFDKKDAVDKIAGVEGTVTKPVTFAKGIIGLAPVFRNYTTKIVVQSPRLNFNGWKQITFSIWLKFNSYSAYGNVYGRKDGKISGGPWLATGGTYSGKWIGGSFGVVFPNAQSEMVSPESLKSGLRPYPKRGVWHHIVGVYDGRHVRVYFNGKLDGETKVATPGLAIFDSPKGITVIGRSSAGHHASWRDTYFPGPVDEIKIWRRALSAAEVKLLHAQTLAKSKAEAPPR